MVIGGITFVAGLLSLLIAVRATGSRRQLTGEPGHACFSCGGPPTHACHRCGVRFCAGHGGRRLCWTHDGNDGSYSITREFACDRCTPSRLQLWVSFALLLVFVGGAITFLVYGFVIFPR